MDWLKIAIEEYKSLREESLTSLNRQQQIVSIGAVTIGIMINAGINAWEKPLLPEIIFLFFLPIIIYIFFIVWFGEVIRMVRAGRFLVEIENNINNKFQGIGMDKPLRWESYLNNKDVSNLTRIRFFYKAISLLFIIVSLLSIVIGNCKILYTKDHQWQYYVLFIDIIEFQLIVFLGFICRHLYRKS